MKRFLGDRRVVLFVVAPCLAAHDGAIGAQQSTPANTAAISGIITDAITGKPVPDARVTLHRVDAGQSREPGAPAIAPLPRMVTDARGRFVFHDLPPAKDYFLDAGHFGYAPTRYGWSKPNGSPALDAIRKIVVDDGQWVNDINIPLWRLGAITGRVVDEHSEPLVGVVVRAFSVENIAGAPQPVAGPLATTDDRGTYRLANISPGRYVVSVLSVQSTVPNSTPDVPQVRAVGELATGGIGGGRGAGVAAPSIDGDGRHRLVVTNFAPPPPSSGVQPRAYRATFFPAVNGFGDATPIDIGYGDSRAGVDFQLQPVPAVRVSGHVETAGGTAPPAFLLRLLPRGSEMLGFGAEAATTRIEPDGTFTFLNVPAGDYTLLAQASVMDFTTGDASTRLPDAPGFPAGGITVGSMRSLPDLDYLARAGQTAPAWGRIPLAVGNSDIADVALPLHVAAKIHGRIAFVEGVTPPPDGKPMLMFAQPANGDPSLGNPNGRTAPNDPTRSFKIEGLMAGTYLLDPLTFIGMLPVSVMVDGHDVKDSGFDGTLGNDFDDVVVTLTDKFAQMTGVVRDDRGPVAATVIAFPVERDRWRGYGWTPRLLQSAPAASDGSYRLKELPEGEYFVLAIDAAQSAEWMDPKFLAAAAPFAKQISVKWGDTSSLDLKVIRVVVK